MVRAPKPPKEARTKKSPRGVPRYDLRKVVRPELETLIDDVSKLRYTGTGKKYGVSDNSIRKWIKDVPKYDRKLYDTI